MARIEELQPTFRADRRDSDKPDKVHVEWLRMMPMMVTDVILKRSGHHDPVRQTQIAATPNL